MKTQNIRVSGDNISRLNIIKYQLELKTVDEAIRRLIEMFTLYQEADKFKGGSK